MKDGVWRTISGRRVFIKNGQSLSDAMRESGKFSNSDIKEKLKKQFGKVDNKKNKEYNKIDDFECLKKYENMSDEELKQYLHSKNDYIMEEMAHENGFDGKPTLVDKESYDQLIKDGNIRVQRVVSDDVNNTSEHYVNEFKNGKYYATNGANMYGNGIYTSGDINDVDTYSKRSGNSKTIEIAIDKNAKIKTFKDQLDVYNFTASELGKIDSKYQTAMENPGRILMAQGYDVAYIEKINYYVIYNRSKLFVKE